MTVKGLCWYENKTLSVSWCKSLTGLRLKCWRYNHTNTACMDSLALTLDIRPMFSSKTWEPDQILLINLKTTDREQLLSPVKPDLHMLKLPPISSIIALFIPPICRLLQYTVHMDHTWPYREHDLRDWNTSRQLRAPRVRALMKHLYIYRC